MKIILQHRTQGRWAEGEHVRGMAEGFRALGNTVILAEPPFVMLEKGAGPQTPAEAGESAPGFLSRLVSTFAEAVPEIVFEAAELAYNLFECPRLLFLFLRERPDLLYSRYSLFTFAPACVARLCNVPFALEVNDATFIERSRPLLLQRLAKRIERWIFSKTDVWITISTQFADMGEAAHRLDRARVLILPNAVSLNRFSPSAMASDTPLTIGMVAAFVHWHGLDFFTSSLPHLFERVPDMRALLVGDGPTRAAVQDKLSAYANRVEFTGFVPREKIPSYLSRMTICLVPDSNPHGSPMKLFEYMAMAKPVVAPEYPAIMEVVKDGETALLFPPLSPEPFCERIIRLARDPQLRRRLGENARAKVIQEHTWNANAARVLERISPQHASHSQPEQ